MFHERTGRCGTSTHALLNSPHAHLISLNLDAKTFHGLSVHLMNNTGCQRADNNNRHRNCCVPRAVFGRNRQTIAYGLFREPRTNFAVMLTVLYVQVVVGGGPTGVELRFVILPLHPCDQHV
jgi:hypothetical protein